MATVIASSVGASMSAATGRSTQGHIQWAANGSAYWLFYLTSTQSLSALYAAVPTGTWTAPTGSPFSLTKVHNSEGRNFGFCVVNLASTDVLHMASDYLVSNECFTFHSRFTLGATWSSTNAEATIGTPAASSGQGLTACSGVTTVLDSSGTPYESSSFLDNGSIDTSGFCAIVGSHADAGSSWTAGFGSKADIAGVSSWTQSSAVFSLGSGAVLAVAGNSPTTNKFTNLNYSKWNGASWSASATALASTVTSADENAWGAVALSTSDIHVVALSNNSNAYAHRRFGGTSWSTGNTIPTLTYGTNSGLSLVSDGTSAWLAAIDTSKNIKYIKWTSGTGWDGAWTTLEAARSNTPSYITGCYSPTRNEILWAWTESTGTNFNLVGSALSLAAAPVPTTFVPFPSIPFALLAM